MVARIDSRNRRGLYERGRLLRRAATRFGEGAARSVPLASSDLVLSCPLRRAGASSVSGNRPFASYEIQYKGDKKRKKGLRPES
uniref:Uncharacterized protein n=1 Tax=Oryza glumipatula TaxID=40148 RepID=A0A0E0AND6_9ORYZ